MNIFKAIAGFFSHSEPVMKYLPEFLGLIEAISKAQASRAPEDIEAAAVELATTVDEMKGMKIPIQHINDFEGAVTEIIADLRKP